jgi:hypothetical protein
MLANVAIDRVQIARRERPAETRVKGFFEVTPQSGVVGWAYDAASPDTHLTVYICNGNATLGTAQATLFRPDLVRAGIGKGDHGFQFKLLNPPPDLTNDAITVHTLAADGSRIPLRIAVAQARDAASEPAGQPIFPGDITDTTQRPVIILGVARSGTSAITQALTASGAYEGFEEGHLLDLLAVLLEQVKVFYAARAEEASAGRSTLLGAVPRRMIEEGIKHIFIEAARRTFPSGRWVDKTPRTAMISALPVLRTLWPNARFIFMRRRAIENLESRSRKFPGEDFETQCREWALSIRGWHAIANSLAGAAMEIDQFFMAKHPAEVAVALRSFLQLDTEAVERLAQALAFDRPEQTGQQFGKISNLADLGWSSQRTAQFRAICGEAMRLAGYVETDAYFAGDAAKYGLVRR